MPTAPLAIQARVVISFLFDLLLICALLNYPELKALNIYYSKQDKKLNNYLSIVKNINTIYIQFYLG